jgi:hypothetical protein
MKPIHKNRLYTLVSSYARAWQLLQDVLLLYGGHERKEAVKESKVCDTVAMENAVFWDVKPCGSCKN